MARTTNKAEDLLTFSRASSGTALTKVAYGPELVTNGTFDTDLSGWTQLQGTIEHNASGALTCRGDIASNSTAQQLVTVEVGKVYEISWDLISGTVVQAYFGTHSNSSNYGLYGYTDSSVYIVATSVYLYLHFRGTNGLVTFDNISVKEVLFNDPTGTLKLISHPTNKPRVEYDANGVAKGLLIEEARTNLLTYSEDFSQSIWAKGLVSVTANAAIAPDGTLSAYKLVEASTVGLRHQIYSGSGIIAESFSIFLKAAERSIVGMYAGTWFSFDLLNGVATGPGAAMVPAGNGWYRCSVPRTNNSSVFIGPSLQTVINDSTWAYDGDGTSGIYIWGAQLEAGSFPTSYIPTTGATATRSADLASVSVSEFGYNQAQGSVVVEMDYAGLGYSETNYNSVYIVCGTNLQRPLYNPQQIAVWDGSGAGAVANANHATNVVYKAASTWGSGSMGVSTNGSTPVFDNAYDGAFGLITDFNLFRGNFLEGGGITGHLKSIKYYPVRLDDDKLKELTL